MGFIIYITTNYTCKPILLLKAYRNLNICKHLRFGGGILVFANLVQIPLALNHFGMFDVALLL